MAEAPECTAFDAVTDDSVTTLASACGEGLDARSTRAVGVADGVARFAGSVTGGDENGAGCWSADRVERRREGGMALTVEALAGWRADGGAETMA